MRKIDLSRLRVGNGVGSDYVRTELTTSDVIRSLCTFSEEHFRGILTVNVINNDSGIVTVCADGLAFFLKMLLCRVFGRTEVTATVNCGRRELHVTLDLGGTSIDTEGLFEIAEHSGFQAELIEDCVIKITTAVKRTSALAIYAADREVFLRALYAAFFMNN